MTGAWKSMSLDLNKKIFHRKHPEASGKGRGGTYGIHLSITKTVEDEVLRLFYDFWRARVVANKKLVGPDLDRNRKQTSRPHKPQPSP